MINSELMILTGSHANNVDLPTSDYDVFVVSNVPTSKKSRGPFDLAFHTPDYATLEFIYPFQKVNAISPAILLGKIINKPATEYSILFDNSREAIFDSIKEEVAKKWLKFLTKFDFTKRENDWHTYSTIKFIRYQFYMTSVLINYPKTHSLLDSLPTKETHDFIWEIYKNKDFDWNTLCSIVTSNIEQAKKAYTDYYEGTGFNIPVLKSIRDKFLDLIQIDIPTLKELAMINNHSLDRTILQLDLDNIPEFYFEK